MPRRPPIFVCKFNTEEHMAGCACYLPMLYLGAARAHWDHSDTSTSVTPAQFQLDVAVASCRLRELPISIAWQVGSILANQG